MSVEHWLYIPVNAVYGNNRCLFSDLHKTNKLCGQNVELLNVKLAVHIGTTGGTCNNHCAVHIVTTVLNTFTRSTSLQSGLDTQRQFVSVTAGAGCSSLIQD